MALLQLAPSLLHRESSFVDLEGFLCRRNISFSGRKLPVTSGRRLFAGRAILSLTLESAAQEWTELESDVAYLTRSARLVQWYPGHIAKAEKKLKEQLQLVDVVVEVRDCRIPLATAHPELEQWIGDKMKILVLNREDMVTTADKNAWAGYYTSQGLTTILTNGQRGSGVMKLERAAKSVAVALNSKRRARGLLPRSVRAAVVGYPNVGKSSVINRLLKQSICETASRPGVTRDLRWTRIAEGLDLMDAPGVLPMRIQDQAAATRLAICNDIGEASYAVAGVASVLVEMLKRVPSLGPQVLTNRYKVTASNFSGEEFLEELGQLMFHGDVNQAALRVLRDFRKGRFGWAALERPPSQTAVSRLKRNARVTRQDSEVMSEEPAERALAQRIQERPPQPGGPIKLQVTVRHQQTLEYSKGSARDFLKNDYLSEMIQGRKT